MTATSSRKRTGRPIGSFKAPPTLTVDANAIVRECWQQALDVVVDGRLAIEALVEAYDSGGLGGHGAVLERAMRFLRAALSVDMRDPANRKGELPKALGFVSSAVTPLRDQAIVWAFERIQEHGATVEMEKRPFSLSDNQCAALVAKGFNAEGIARRLTADAVNKVVQRIRSK